MISHYVSCIVASHVRVVRIHMGAAFLEAFRTDVASNLIDAVGAHGPGSRAGHVTSFAKPESDEVQPGDFRTGGWRQGRAMAVFIRCHLRFQTEIARWAAQEGHIPGTAVPRLQESVVTSRPLGKTLQSRVLKVFL